MAVVGRCVSIAILVAPAQQAVQPLPQPPGSGGGVQHHYYLGGAPSAGGYSHPGNYRGGADLSGITNPAAARGQHNMDTAQAMQTLSATKHRSIENHNYVEIRKNCEAMRKILDGKVRDLPMPTFCAADHFLRSLDYEGQFAVVPSGGQLAAK